jgi:hypothetical protein
LLKSDGNVYKSLDYTSQTPISTGGGYSQIAGSVNGLVYALNSGTVWMFNTWSGSESFIAAGRWQISAGTDFWGNSTVDMVNGYGVYQYNAASGNFKVISGSATEMAAGEGGHDYYVDSYSQLHDRADQWYFYWNPVTGHVTARESVTDSVIGYNVS